MTLCEFASRLDGIKTTSRGLIARCPAHSDRTPSLSITEGPVGLLIHCFAGCRPAEIVGALGLSVRDLFADAPMPRGKRPNSKPPRLDLPAIAFRFELAAFDRRRRAETVLMASRGFDDDGLADEVRDRLMCAVISAHDDLQRAELLEGVADDLRLRAYHERTTPHAA